VSGTQDLRGLVVDLATELREQVLPALGAHTGRAHAAGGDAEAGDLGAVGASGDITFAIDAQAEAHLERFVAERAPGLAFFSEDRGLVEPAGAAEHVLVVDPIDGTRPALAGFEAACVSVALAELSDGQPTMGDVEIACIVEIKSGERFEAIRGQGVSATVPVGPSGVRELDRLFWVYGLRGRPAVAMMEVLGELVDGASVGGGTFELGSATYDMTRVLTGQLDAYVEPGPRMIDEIPGMRAEFERVGRGAVLNNTPYDLAAAALCCSEGGVVVTDANGRSLDDRPLLGSGHDFQMSVIASANRELHEQLLRAVDAGIERARAARS
jgi:myo-inositol-1(or 4)-monophosphatase